MMNRALDARLSKLETARMERQPIRFITIYEDRNGKPERVTSLTVDPSDPENRYTSSEENPLEFL